MSRKSNEKIQKSHLILCEGRDAEEFLISYLNSEALSGQSGFSQEIQVMDFGGNEALPRFLELLMNMEGFSDVKSILILRDAERDGARAAEQIKSALGRLDLPTPNCPCCWTESALQVGFLLFPACDDRMTNGTLEDLCLSILAEEGAEEVLEKIDGFMSRLKADCGRTFPHAFKTKLHT